MAESGRQAKVLFLGKRGDACCAQAADFVARNFPDATIHLGQRLEPLPAELDSWEGDLLISYLSPWIAPAQLLARIRRASLNFHPGPPEYPGIGCTNFAIYNQESVFGVTCHHMLPRVDSGRIIAVSRFPLLASDSVFSLTQRCYAYILVMFYDLLLGFLAGRDWPDCGETWRRAPYTRRQLNELCRVSPEMPDEEVRRRVRATSYPGMPGAYLELAGARFAAGPGEV